MGLDFVVRPSDCDESWHPGEAPVDYAARVARAKLEACPRADGERRLAADTTVWTVSDGAPLGKPATRDEARAMLRELEAVGTHQVTTAYAHDAERGVVVAEVTTRVTFRALGPAELERYLDTDEWRDKAGGYGIQASAASFVSRVEGSYTNVVGLPLAELSAWLVAGATEVDAEVDGEVDADVDAEVGA